MATDQNPVSYCPAYERLCLAMELSGAATPSLKNRLVAIEGRGNTLGVVVKEDGFLREIEEQLNQCDGVVEWCDAMEVRDHLVAERDVIRAELVRRGQIAPEDVPAC